MSSCVVRIRPAAQSYIGRSIGVAQAVAETLSPGAASSGFDVEFLLDVPLAFSELEDMAEVLVNGATADDVIFVEANFPTREVARSYQVLDSLVTGLLAQESVLESLCQVVVAMHELPNRVDQVYELLMIERLGGRLAIVDDAGGHLGNTELARLLITAMEQHPLPADNVEHAILRHRGVFRSRGSGRVSNYVFYYEALPKASSRFQKCLVDALTAVRPDLVLFDASTSGAWFASMVSAACVQLQTTHSATLTSVEISQWIAYQEGALQEPQRSRVEAAVAVLSRPGSTLAMVVPAYASGRSLTRALEIVDSPDLRRCTAIAVFADTAASLRPSRLPGMAGVARRPYGGQSMEVHCMHQVELRTIDRDDWLVAAAEVLNEVRDLPVANVDHGAIGRTAFWSLYSDCGVDVERVPAGGRLPKRYFPDLARLDDWDAHWLAEALVVNILTRLPRSNRAALLVVIPDEVNGTQSISHALLEKCRIAVLPIPRAMIEGDELVTQAILDKLRLHTADTIAVLDESTVTHGTLAKLSRVVESGIRIRPDLIGTVIDVSMSPPDLGIPYFSLTNWAALAEGATS
jgi:hypothetical protein